MLILISIFILDVVFSLIYDELFHKKDGSFGKNVIIFGADMSSSVHADNKKKDILVLDKVSSQGLNNTTLTAEAEYSISFTEHNKTICLSLHYNGSKSYLFVNWVKVYRFKAKDSDLFAYPLCSGNISKDFSVADMNETWLLYFL